VPTPSAAPPPRSFDDSSPHDNATRRSTDDPIARGDESCFLDVEVKVFGGAIQISVAPPIL